jgi:glycosyltransferase involved in cell wall biosynthesis
LFQPPDFFILFSGAFPSKSKPLYKFFYIKVFVYLFTPILKFITSETLDVMMKIALTTEYFHPETGGAEQSALELAKAIRKKGHDIVVFTRGKGEEDEVDGVPVKRMFRNLEKRTVGRDVPLPRVVDMNEEARLYNEIKGEGFEIIHSNNRDTAVFSARVGTMLDIASIAHIRDYWPICPKRDFLRPEGICPKPKLCGNCMARFFNAWHKVAFYYKMWNDTSYRWQEIREHVKYFVYNSHYTQQRIELEPGSVVYNPIDIEIIKRAEEEPGKVLFIGNVTERKGILRLVEAVKGMDLTLHIIGDGYLSSKIEGNNIIKHGRVEYSVLLDHLSTAEMLVVPSLWPEPFGRVAVEGMAAGIPVIVSPEGGLPEVVGEGGMVLKGVETEDIRDTIYVLHEDHELRNKLGEKGLERSKMFHPEKIADDMIMVYKNLLDSG